MTNECQIAKVFSQYQCRCSGAHLPDLLDQPTMLDFTDSRNALASWISSKDEHEHVSRGNKSFSWAVEEGARTARSRGAERPRRRSMPRTAPIC